MKSRTLCGMSGILLLLTVAQAEIPNRFEFVSADYFISKGTTNAVITVHFYPGTRGWNGSVDFATQAGTAVAGQDFVATSGTLNFSGTPFRTFTVPLTGNSEQTKTIQVVLSPSSFDPSATITRSNAVVHIDLPPPPKLTIAPGPAGALAVSWVDDGTDPLLEKLAPDSTWTVLAPVPGDGNGGRRYLDTSSGGMGLYRLRREQ